MDRVTRLRRVALLCVHFLRNSAYYRAGWNEGKTLAVDEFSVTIQGNFMDIAILEWAKLFGGFNDEHHWNKVVEDTDSFKNKMFEESGITEDQFKESWSSIKVYRDKFVAHLDSEKIMNIPVLDIPIAVTKYYYNFALNELEAKDIKNLPIDIESYYTHCLGASEEYYRSINT